MAVRRADLEAVLAFIGGDIMELDSDGLYPIEFLTGLQELVPSGTVVYQEADYRAKRFPVLIASAPDDDDGNDVYWSTGPCPTQAYRERTGDLRAVRTSDVIEPLSYHELPIYREYFRPAQIEHILDLGLPARPGRTRSLLFFREIGEKDFSERDRDILEVLRPHLRRFETHALLRRRLAEALRGSSSNSGGPLITTDDGGGESDVYHALTRREREIVELVAEGKTNAEIAATLWVAPSTVKKHLENVYAKTGIGRRAAIAAGRFAPRT